jgi:hypothetical protein
MEQEAEGIAAQEAARGLAEAKVMIAKAGARKSEADPSGGGPRRGRGRQGQGRRHAEVTETQAEAEAEGTKDKELADRRRHRGPRLAEAKSIEEKARGDEAPPRRRPAARGVPLRLAKERDVELASIHVSATSPRPTASVVGEALKSPRSTSSAARTTSSRRSSAPSAPGRPWTAWSDNSDHAHRHQEHVLQRRPGTFQDPSSASGSPTSASPPRT